MLIIRTGDIRSYGLFGERYGCECCSKTVTSLLIFWKSYYLNDLLQLNVIEIIINGDIIMFHNCRALVIS